MNLTFFKYIFIFSLFFSFLSNEIHAQTITGDSQQYHKTTITFNAVNLSEEPATYLNYRMNVTFTSPSDKTYVVPGYFAADGDAAETSAVRGNKWRCHFTPNEPGDWSYSVSFRTGNNIAVNSNTTAGTSTSIDGDSGDFNIAPTTVTGNDFRAKGKLQYVGEDFAQFDNGDYFFEVGADSPETFLEYGDFDATTGRNDYAEVSSNYVNGDPSWQNGKGTEIIGAVNYLANEGMNVHYFLTMNITGDGENAYPFPNDTDYTTYDVSKLDQWQIVFDHMYNKGIALEFVLAETENNNWFEEQEGIDVSDFSNSRKLYYREMIARFGYLNVIYNISEEANWKRNNNDDVLTAEQINEAAEYIQTTSPYNDLVSVHNGPSDDFTLFPELTALNGTSALTTISVQGNFGEASHGHDEIRTVKDLATADNKEWVVRYTEPFSGRSPNIELWTENSLWASITAGASGIHYYAGGGQDVTEDDYTEYAPYYQRMKHAKDFIEDNSIPVWDMSNDDASISTGYLLSGSNNYHIAFLPDGGSATIDLEGTNDYTVKWFDPRDGGDLQDGSVTNISSGNNVSIGNPPSDTSSSWVALIENVNILGIEDNLGDSKIDFQVYPNPTNSSNKIYVSGLNNDSLYEIALYDLQGKLINKKDIASQNNIGELDVAYLKSGIYFLIVNTGDSSYTAKIIINQ